MLACQILLGPDNAAARHLLRLRGLLQIIHAAECRIRPSNGSSTLASDLEIESDTDQKDRTHGHLLHGVNRACGFHRSVRDLHDLPS